MSGSTTSRSYASRVAARARVVVLDSLDVESDHKLLKDCEGESGWKNAGALCKGPAWTPTSQRPISLTMDQVVRIRLAVRMMQIRPGHPPMEVKLHGTGSGGMEFKRESLVLRSGPASIGMVSSKKIERKVQKLRLALRWTAPNVRVSPSVTLAVVYVTFGRPKDDKQDVWPEDGVTLKRMDRAVSWIASLGTLDPHEIVGAILAKYPNYTLKPSPKVPRKYHHPTYFNDEGGAWPMSDYVEESGECQAIVRLIRGMLRQTGVPGKTRVIAIWADPHVGGGRTVLSADMEETPSAGLDTAIVVDGKRWIAVLIDGPVEEGKTYPASHTALTGGELSPGLNRYEACLEFSHGEITRYYAGGAGVFSDKEQVLSVFWGLIWVSAASRDGFRVEKIVAKYGANEGAP